MPKTEVICEDPASGGGYFVVVKDMDTYTECYDAILWCLGAMLRKHKAGYFNALLASSQVDLFVKNPLGLVLLHFDWQNKIDGFATVLSVHGDYSWIEIVHLWFRPGEYRKLVESGFNFIRAYARGKWGSKRIMISITRSPRALYKKFYGPLGFTPFGMILEMDL